MKNLKKLILINFSLMLFATFIMGVFDDAFVTVYQPKTWIDYIFSSLKYYIFWVLPYWWFIILFVTTLLSLLMVFLLYMYNTWMKKR
jgi:hypothetical protein